MIEIAKIAKLGGLALYIYTEGRTRAAGDSARARRGLFSASARQRVPVSLTRALRLRAPALLRLGVDGEHSRRARLVQAL